MRRAKREREREGGHGEKEVQKRGRREEGTGRTRVWVEEMEGRPIRGREDLSAGDGCADSKG